MPLDYSTKEYEVGPTGLDYVKAQLALGGRLAGLLSHRPLDKGQLSAFLPERLPEWTFEDFGSGCVSLEFGHYSEAKTYPDTYAPVARSVTTYLGEESGQARFAVFEDPVWTPTAPFLARVDVPFFECSEHIYWFARRPSSAEAARRLMAKGSWYPGIGVLSWLPAHADPIRDRAVINESVLTQLAENAACILVQAWDQEAWLLWQPSS